MMISYFIFIIFFCLKEIENYKSSAIFLRLEFQIFTPLFIFAGQEFSFLSTNLLFSYQQNFYADFFWFFFLFRLLIAFINFHKYLLFSLLQAGDTFSVERGFRCGVILPIFRLFCPLFEFFIIIFFS